MTQKQCPVPGCERPGTTGGECIPHKFDGGIRVNGIALFQADRALGVTQAQKAREMFETSRADKVDIQAVRGRRRPHEVRRNGAWEKV